jgi:hypothetical protein
MVVDDVLDLQRRHVLAPPAHDVLLAVDEVVLPVGVAAGHVAGVQPTVAQRFCGFLRIVEVPQHVGGTA